MASAWPFSGLGDHYRHLELPAPRRAVDRRAQRPRADADPSSCSRSPPRVALDCAARVQRKRATRPRPGRRMGEARGGARAAERRVAPRGMGRGRATAPRRGRGRARGGIPRVGRAAAAARRARARARARRRAADRARAAGRAVASARRARGARRAAWRALARANASLLRASGRLLSFGGMGLPVDCRPGWKRLPSFEELDGHTLDGEGFAADERVLRR